MSSKKLRFPGRSKSVYFGGMLLAGVGVLLLLAEILAVAQNPSVFTEPEAGSRSLLFGGLLSVGLVLAGFTAMTANAQSVSVVSFRLDPKLEKDDRRLAGVDDAEVSSTFCCRSCHAMNAENAKFCNQCGSRF